MQTESHGQKCYTPHHNHRADGARDFMNQFGRFGASGKSPRPHYDVVTALRRADLEDQKSGEHAPGHSPESKTVSQALRTFLECEPALKRFLARMLPSTLDVEDIAQEAFLRTFVASSTQTVLAPKAFLFRVAKNLAINQRSLMWNTTTNLVGNSGDLETFCSGNDVSGEDRLDSQRKMDLFAEAIAHLPTQCRRVFLLRKIDELSHKEIAARMGISISTVEKHIAIGLVRCNDYLTEHGYGVGGTSNPKPLKAAKLARIDSREAAFA